MSIESAPTGQDFESVPDSEIPWLPNGITVGGRYCSVTELDDVFGRDRLGVWLFQKLLTEAE